MLTDIGFTEVNECFTDIEVTRRILNRASIQDQRARKFLDIINQIFPVPGDGEGSTMQNLLLQPESSWTVQKQVVSALKANGPSFLW